MGDSDDNINVISCPSTPVTYIEYCDVDTDNINLLRNDVAPEIVDGAFVNFYYEYIP